MPLTIDDARWVAHLARLELSEAQLETLTTQLRAIVEYVQLLQQVDTSGVEPMAHGLEINNVFRPDEPAQSLAVDAALANAPERRQGHFSVPAVLE